MSDKNRFPWMVYERDGRIYFSLSIKPARLKKRWPLVKQQILDVIDQVDIILIEMRSKKASKKK